MSLSEEISVEFGIGAADLERIIQTAPARYKIFEIPKRTGGVRVIAQPAKELKSIQHYLLEKKLSHLPVHNAAAAYIKGRNILYNARKHMEASCFLKLDFRDFFPSIIPADFIHVVSRLAQRRQNIYSYIEPNDFKQYLKLLFWSRLRNSAIPRCLSIGAPTSPALSNAIMFDLDTLIDEATRGSDVTYTRYADDITLSAENEALLSKVEKEIRRIVRLTKRPLLAFNEQKRGLYRRGQKQMITGLVLTPKHQVSIGRHRKRTIATLLYLSMNGKLSIAKKAYLKGMLGFAAANEPALLDRLRQKYGSPAVTDAMTFHIPKREFLAQ